uniref:Secretory calcium-binding phosphoprotein 5 n=1 Tax=Myripristis murdjan TaxID=586833 RepID=A0A667WGX2_9TELE
MKLAILCLCLASTVSAAPPFFHYLPHYGANRQPAPQITAPAVSCVNTAYPGAQPQPQPGVPAPISMEISFPSQAIIKYSLPKAPGRKSVEIVSFSSQTVFLFQIPTFDASPPQAQDPLQPAQPAQPTQTNEVIINS